MEWLPVMEPDTCETVEITSYECNKCGYIATWKWERCPHCREKWDMGETEGKNGRAVSGNGKV